MIDKFLISRILSIIFSIFILIYFIFYLNANQFFDNQKIFNISFVLTLAVFFLIFYFIWFVTNVFIPSKSKIVLCFLIRFLIDVGEKDRLFNILKPYFSDLNDKSLKKIVKSKTINEKYVSKCIIPLKKKPLFFKMYLVYIMMLLVDENEKKEEEVLLKYINLIAPNSKVKQIVEYYTSATIIKNSDKRNIIRVWESYKQLGIFPGLNTIKLKRKISNHSNKKESKKLYNKIISYQNTMDYGYNRYKRIMFWFNIGFIFALSVIFIFVGNIAIYLIHLFVIYITVVTIRDYTKSYNNEYLFKRGDKYKNSGFMTLLLAEIGIRFLKDRYNLDDNKIKGYLLNFMRVPFDHEIYFIIKENKQLQIICKIINNSGYHKNKFIDLLFDIAAADKVFSDKEDAYINQVAEYLKVDKKEVKKIRAQYLKRGVTEKKTRQRTYKSSSSFSSSMVSYYSSKAYKILGIEKTASADEIKKAYRALAMKHHPDKFATKGEKAMEQAEDIFQVITDAYELIKRLRNIN